LSHQDQPLDDKPCGLAQPAPQAGMGPDGMMNTRGRSASSLLLVRSEPILSAGRRA